MSRLLILVERSDDLPPIHAWLRPTHTVLDGYEQNLHEPLDLLIVDAPVLSRLEDRIAERKALDADDAFPVLLLATHEDLLQVTPRAWSLVDAILKLPVQASELTGRVDWLVQTQARLHQVKHSERLLQEQAEEIKKVNRAVLTLSACNHALVQASREDDLLREICRVTVEVGGYRMAWVGIPENGDDKLIRPVASSGYDAGYLDDLPLSWDANKYGGQGPAAMALRTGRHQVVQHISSHQTFVRQEQAAERGYQAVATLPLFEGDHVCAVLVVYAEEPNSFDKHEVDLLQQLASDLSYGLTRLRERQAHQEAQSVLARVQSNYQQIVDKAQEGIWLLDAEFKTEYVNPCMADMLGYAPEEMIGRSIVDFMYPDEAPRAPDLMDLRRRGVSAVLEVTYRHKRGHAVHCLLSSNPMLDEQGELIGVLGMAVDITERRQMEQALREQNALEESLRDIASVLTGTLSLKQVMIQILENVGKVVPHDAGNIMIIEGDHTRPLFWRGSYGSYQEETFKTLDYSVDSGTFKIMMKTGQPVVLPSTEGSEDWFGNEHNAWIKSYIGMPIRAHGSIIGFLNLDSATPNFFNAGLARRLQIFADQAAVAIENAQLYERMRGYASELEKRVEARTADLQRAKEEVEAILNSSSDAVLVMSMTGSILQANRAFGQLIGGAPAAKLHDHFGDHLDEASAAAVTAALNDAIVLEQSVRLEANVRRADGTLIATELTLAPMLQAHAGGIVCNIHDISERKQVEQDLRRALETEKELGEIKSRFISMASHEFRTPLAVVLSSSELLKLYADRMSDERRTEHYNIIETSIKNLTRLIDDVLTIGRVDSGRMEFNPQPLDLAPFCQALADETMVAFPNSAPVQFTPKSPCPEAVLDHRLLRQLLSNLLSNAIKYTPDLTPVEFTLQCTGDSAIFAVLDHGMGMSHKDMHHLFEAFYRSPQVSEIPGTGLGLAIMKRAVDLHGGTVDFTSTLGDGTKVVVTLPLKPVLLERAAAPEQAAEF